MKSIFIGDKYSSNTNDENETNSANGNSYVQPLIVDNNGTNCAQLQINDNGSVFQNYNGFNAQVNVSANSVNSANSSNSYAVANFNGPSNASNSANFVIINDVDYNNGANQMIHIDANSSVIGANNANSSDEI